MTHPPAAHPVPGAGLAGGRIVRALAWARSGGPARASLIAARSGASQALTAAALDKGGTASAGPQPG